VVEMSAWPRMRLTRNMSAPERQPLLLLLLAPGPEDGDRPGIDPASTRTRRPSPASVFGGPTFDALGSSGTQGFTFGGAGGWLRSAESVGLREMILRSSARVSGSKNNGRTMTKVNVRP
jgi:hypothetical protein